MDCYGKKLLLLGDSIMFGSGNGGFGVGEYLERDLGVKLYKYCVGGARVGYDEGKDWMVEQTIRAIGDNVECDIVVFDGFTNDCYQTDGVHCDVSLGETSEGYEGFDIYSVKKSATFSECFENIVAALKKYFPEAKYLFVRPHKMGRRDAKLQVDYGERALSICKKWDIPVADIYSVSDLDTFNPEQRDKYTCDSYGWGRGDCTHPNALGYTEKYMPVIEAALKNL